MAVLGFTRKGSRVVASITAAIHAARNGGPASKAPADRQRVPSPSPVRPERGVGRRGSLADAPYPGLHPDYLSQLRANGLLPPGS